MATNSSEFGELSLDRPADDSTMMRVFVGSLVILISIANMLMGCEIDLNMVFATLKKPIAPGIGIVTQFGLMPILAYVISQLVLVPRGLHSFALGLFVTGCAPGGGASNYWTLLLGGNVNLSATMTFISTSVSIITIPLWMNILGYKFLRGEDQSSIKVPYVDIIRGLFMLLVPLLIGVAIAKKWPNFACKARKVLRPFIIFVLIFLITFGTYANWYMFQLLSPSALVGGLLLPWCGFMCGCFLSLILRQKPQDVTAIAIETGVQNTGVAIMLLKSSFEQPQSDISSFIPIIVACFTPGPLLLGYGVHRFFKWLKNRKEYTVDVEKEPACITFSSKSDAPLSPSSPLRCKVNDEFNRPLIRCDDSNNDMPMTDEEKAAYVEDVLDQVLLPGVIPD